MGKKTFVIAILVILLFGIGYFIFQVGFRGTPIAWLLSFGPTYKSCVCCCPNVAGVRKCLYRSKGDDIDEILKKDKLVDCSQFGCAAPIEYKYCD